MPARLIHIIEDNPSAAATARVAVEREGYDCHVSPDGDTALRDFKRLTPSLVLLDLGLPGVPGLELLDCMRRSRPDVPVIIITAEMEELTELIGLEKGADDFITKPIRPKALVARIRAVLRRSQPPSPPPPPSGPEPDPAIEVGGISLDPVEFTCRANGTAVELSASEMALLHHIMKRPRWLHSREQLIESVYGDDPPADSRAIDGLISPLRRKLRPHLGGINPFLAKPRVGYRLNPALLEQA